MNNIKKTSWSLSLILVVVTMILGCGKEPRQLKVVKLTQALADVAKRYNEIYPFENGVAFCSNGDRNYLYIDTEGNIVDNKPSINFSGEYESIQYLPEDSIYILEKVYRDFAIIIKTEYYIADMQGHILTQYERAGWYDDRISEKDQKPKFTEGLCGLVDSTGAFYIDRQGNRVLDGYKWAFPFIDGIAMVQTKNNECVFINHQGERVGKGLVGVPGYRSKDQDRKILYYEHGLAVFEGSGGLCGLYDIKNDRQLIAPQYHHIRQISSDGQLLVVERYKDLNDFAFTHITGVITIDGREVLPCKYAGAEFANGLIVLEEVSDDKDLRSFSTGCVYGVFDSKGKEVLPLKYSEVTVFEHCIRVEKKRELKGLYSLDGSKLLPCKYYYIGEEHDYLLKVQETREGLMGYYDADGIERIKPIYDQGNDFSEGLAFVKKNGVGGFVNAAGEDTF